MWHNGDPDRFFRKRTCDNSQTGHLVEMGGISLVFSYETVVAFAVSGYGWCVSENVWSRTTGKHINNLTPSGERLPRADFLRMLAVLMRWFDTGGMSYDDLVYQLRLAEQTPVDLSTPERVEAFIA